MTYEQSISRKDHIIANLTKALQKQVRKLCSVHLYSCVNIHVVLCVSCRYILWLLGNGKQNVAHVHVRHFVCHALPSNQNCYRLIAGYWVGGGDHDEPRG